MLVCKSCILDYGLKSLGIQSFMIGNCEAMSAVGHSDVFAFSYGSETDFDKCPDNPFGGEVSKEHFRQ